MQVFGKNAKGDYNGCGMVPKKVSRAAWLMLALGAIVIIALIAVVLLVPGPKPLQG